MHFKIDENLPREMCELLAAAGHNALTVADQGLSGAPDSTIADVCRKERRSLVTLDIDFADIRAYPPADYPGMIVLRPSCQDKRRLLDVARQLLPLLGVEPLDGYLWIVDDAMVRIRGESGK